IDIEETRANEITAGLLPTSVISLIGDQFHALIRTLASRSITQRTSRARTSASAPAGWTRAPLLRRMSALMPRAPTNWLTGSRYAHVLAKSQDPSSTLLAMNCGVVFDFAHADPFASFRRLRHNLPCKRLRNLGGILAVSRPKEPRQAKADRACLGFDRE